MIVEPPKQINKKKKRPPVPQFEDSPSKKEIINELKTEEKKPILIEQEPIRQRDESAPKVNLDLISQLYKQKFKGDEPQPDKKKSQIAVLDEYDPARPNDYEQVLKNRKKRKDDDDMKIFSDEISSNKKLNGK